MEEVMDQRIDQLREWLRDEHPEVKDIGLDTDLLEGVLTDSLEFITFLVLVEDLRGEPIAADEVDRESFRTLNVIQETFLSDDAGA
ncbi:MAG: acyl carrier protein [Actinomycetota bacterium]|nr:acyl carrier protein [Actinomycetota bacterium]